MANLELNARKIVDQLKGEGWVSEGGAKHDKFKHPSRPGESIIVPRHRTMSPGVARSIARAAGWM